MVLFDFSVRLNYSLVVLLTYIIDFFYIVFVENKKNYETKINS